MPAALTRWSPNLSERSHPEEQSEGQVGHCVGHGTGGIGDDDAALSAVIEVHLVEADAVAGDDLELCCLVHGGGVEVFAAGQQGVDAVQLRARLLVEPAGLGVPDLNGEAGAFNKLAGLALALKLDLDAGQDAGLSHLFLFFY